MSPRMIWSSLPLCAPSSLAALYRLLLLGEAVLESGS
jgi:hypothetical protein